MYLIFRCIFRKNEIRYRADVSICVFTGFSKTARTVRLARPSKYRVQEMRKNCTLVEEQWIHENVRRR